MLYDMAQGSPFTISKRASTGSISSSLAISATVLSTNLSSLCTLMNRFSAQSGVRFGLIIITFPVLICSLISSLRSCISRALASCSGLPAIFSHFRKRPTKWGDVKMPPVL